MLDKAFPKKAAEQVLIQSKRLDAGDPQFKAAVADVTRRLRSTEGVDSVSGPYAGRRARSRRTGIPRSSTSSSPATARDRQVGGEIARRGRRVGEGQSRAPCGGNGRRQPDQGAHGQEQGGGGQVDASDHPDDAVILVFAFGALVAAGIPILLALTSVAATMGLLGPVSHLAPVDGSVLEVVLLIGMAVGVDYSLFYIKRAREERAAGRGNNAAIEAAAATSGRAVMISGATVMVAMAGMYLGGISNFASFATGTIIVVAVAVLGSLTVLPALLSKLGDRVEKGRVPLVGRLKNRVGAAGVWSRILDRVLRRPLVLGGRGGLPPGSPRHSGDRDADPRWAARRDLPRHQGDADL